MRVLVELTYYRPHTSGLTIYAERLAKALVKRGHEVTILTSQYEKTLPRQERIDGINIIRVPVLFRINKGVIMPSFGWVATKLVKQTDVVHLHLPQFDAAGVAFRARLFRKPCVITYHCDLLLPKGIFNWFVNQVVHLMNYLACLFTNVIVTYTEDYADNSSLLRKFKKKLRVINPPVEMPTIDEQKSIFFRKTNNLKGHHPVIGFAARFATEKGVEILVNAMQIIFKKYPDALVWFAGPYGNIIGEESYFQRLTERIHYLEQNGHWRFLGSLNSEEMAAFYSNLDVLVLPSLNSTEAFGLVQIEAMMNGKPCVASNLPGVRQPVIRHQMGAIIPIGDSEKLAEEVIKIAEDKSKFSDINNDWQEYSPDEIAKRFEELFFSLRNEIHG
jgi:glycosyltransferase involved in cell wall biosynthesis